MSAAISVTQFRDGRWHESSGLGVTETINPATGVTIAIYQGASATDLDLALDSLRTAYPQWKSAALSARQLTLGRIADEILIDKERIAHQMTQEMGKTLRESLIEVEIFASTCRWYQHEAGRAIGSVLPSADGSRMIHTRRKPMGVVACITPWNFPIVLAGYKIFAALAVGNVVLWKPAQQINGTAMLVAEAFERAGVGAEFCLLGAATGQLASQAVTDPRVDAVSFTGSTQVGIQISQALAPRLVPCSLELGGKNAAVVLADADLDIAAEHIVRSAFLTSGQRCTATSRIIVESSVAEPLLERVIVRMEALVVGAGTDPEVDLGPLATPVQRDNVEKAVAAAIAAGAMLRSGGSRPEHLSDDGYFYSPTLLDHVDPSMAVATEEIFGPVIAMIRVKNSEQAYDIANGTDYGLSTSVFTRSLSAAHRSMDALDSGLIYINRGTSAAELGVPFGGTGLSGNGHREVSAHGFEFMTELVSVYVDPGNGG
jgi:aldehyde dehydrogenase (NAD+)